LATWRQEIVDTSVSARLLQLNCKAPGIKDLERALAETHADVVVLSIGNGDSVRKSYSAASAHAIVQGIGKATV
jgi:hypothetical protein